MTTIDSDSLLHPTNISTGCISRISKVLESWDKVQMGFDSLKEVLEKVVNKIIRNQNEIHIRVEQRRRWGSTHYTVEKFDYLGEKFKLFLVDEYKRSITNDNNFPLVFELDKSLVLQSHFNETFINYFTEYEANLIKERNEQKASIELQRKQLLQCDFEKAKEFYFAYKEHFEKLEVEAQNKILSFDELEKQNYPHSSTNDNIEQSKNQEYELYVQHTKLGIE